MGANEVPTGAATMSKVVKRCAKSNLCSYCERGRRIGDNNKLMILLSGGNRKVTVMSEYLSHDKY